MNLGKLLFALQRIPAQCRARKRTPLALLLRFALSLYLRRRFGALVLQQRGYPGIPLSKYTPEMRHREYFTDKFCGPRCTVSCVQQIGILTTGAIHKI
jgi:hypothetical protein